MNKPVFKKNAKLNFHCNNAITQSVSLSFDYQSTIKWALTISVHKCIVDSEWNEGSIGFEIIYNFPILFPENTFFGRYCGPIGQLIFRLDILSGWGFDGFK